jgi:hypothetical protein
VLGVSAISVFSWQEKKRMLIKKRIFFISIDLWLIAVKIRIWNRINKNLQRASNPPLEGGALI